MPCWAAWVADATAVWSLDMAVKMGLTTVSLYQVRVAELNVPVGVIEAVTVGEAVGVRVFWGVIVGWAVAKLGMPFS